MKVSVTGATGFIGRHVLPLLLDDGVELSVVVRDARKISYMKDKCRIVEHDLDHDDVDIYNKLGQPDVLLHLAWDGLPNYKSLHHFEHEVPKHYYFIKHMVEAGVKSVSVVGTCFEYGMQFGELSEELDAIPTNPYGYAKDALRRQLEFLQERFDYNLTWMRLFYMYGDDQPDNTLYSQLRLAIQRHDSVFNMSGGEQLRDYLHINDVAKNIVKLSLKHKNIGIVNICSGKPISIRRLVEKWLYENNWNINLNLGYYSYPDYEPISFWGCDKKLNKVLNE